MAVSLATHAGLKVMVMQKLAPISTRILDFLV